MITLFVPSFNHEKYIKKCIESIVSQTYKDFQLYVIDDGSSDGSRKIIRIAD